MNYRQAFTNAIIAASDDDEQLPVSVPLSYSTAPEAMVRIYDDYVKKDKFCVFIQNGIVEVSISCVQPLIDSHVLCSFSWLYWYFRFN
jgi:hypothetical protein